MKEINPKELRLLVKNAYKKGLKQWKENSLKRERIRQLIVRTEKSVMSRKSTHTILFQILPIKLEETIRKYGRYGKYGDNTRREYSSVLVMLVRKGNLKRGESLQQKPKPELLRGVAKIVYEYCKDAELSPSLASINSSGTVWVWAIWIPLRILR